MKICIISAQHISTNPRVWKEAGTLSANGHEVSIVTIVNSSIHRDRDKAILDKLGEKVNYIIAANLIYQEISFVEKLRYKTRASVARGLKKIYIESIYLLSVAATEIYKAAALIDADLYIAHAEAPLYVGKQLLKSGKRVAFDFEDWYSRDYLVPSRPVRLLNELEDNALKAGLYVTCPSLAMAEALQTVHNTPRVPHVIYNGFPAEKLPARKENALLTLVWFSQTIGPGRGLEKICNVLSRIKSPMKLVLVGNCSESYRNTLSSILQKRSVHELQIIPPVPHQQLHNLLSTFDIGLALEDVYPDSRNKTVTNKILQYLQAGLKVLATDTDGQKEIARLFPEAVQQINAKDDSNWEASLDALIKLETNREDIAQKFNEVFSWEVQEKKLLQLVHNVA